MKKPTKSNMYPWVDEMISHLHGKCSHGCSYCYVPNTRTARLYTGPVRLNEKVFLKTPRRDSKVLFFDHMNDLFAADVPTDWIMRVGMHALKILTGPVPHRQIVFQTKNPARYLEPRISEMLRTLDVYGNGCLLGCTMESTIYHPGITARPTTPAVRSVAMEEVSKVFKTFLTIEPILKTEVKVMLKWIRLMNPAFINIGADSKRHNLPEPSAEEVRELIAGIQKMGIEIRQKHNLDRLLS